MRHLSMCLALIVQVAAVYGQLERERIAIRLGIGFGYGIRLGDREVSCSGVTPSRNVSTARCGSTRVNVFFPNLRLDLRVRILNAHKLFGIIGIEGLDRSYRNDFRSNRPDTLTYDRYVIRTPQFNLFMSMSKAMGDFEIGAGASTMLFEWATYNRWRIDGTKERWLPTRRLLRSFRVRPQIMLAYAPSERMSRYRIFCVADLRDKFDEDRNTLDVRLGLLYGF